MCSPPSSPQGRYSGLSKELSRDRGESGDEKYVFFYLFAIGRTRMGNWPANATYLGARGSQALTPPTARL